MSGSEKTAPAPEPLIFCAGRLHVPSGLPRCHRAPGGLGHRSFACPIVFPPEQDCPIIRATLKVHAVLVGIAGVVLLGCDAGEMALGPGSAVGLLPGDYTVESVGARADVGPVIIIAVVTPGALDRSFAMGDLFQMHLNEAMEPMAWEPAPEPVGGIHPLPSFAEEVGPFQQHLPLGGFVRSIIRGMGGPVPHQDFYRYLALGPARHRVGLECTVVPDRFDWSRRRSRAEQAAGSWEHEARPPDPPAR